MQVAPSAVTSLVAACVAASGPEPSSSILAVTVIGNPADCAASLSALTPNSIDFCSQAPKAAWAPVSGTIPPIVRSIDALAGEGDGLWPALLLGFALDPVLAAGDALEVPLLQPPARSANTQKATATLVDRPPGRCHRGALMCSSSSETWRAVGRYV